MLQRISLAFILSLALSGCAHFDAYWNTLATSTRFKVPASMFMQRASVTIPAGWRVFPKENTPGRLVATVNGNLLNEIVVRHEKIAGSCWVDNNKETEQVTLIALEGRYKKCAASSGDYKVYTFYGIKILPVKRAGLDGIHAISDVKNVGESYFAVTSLLESYILVAPDKKSLITVEYYATKEENYSRYKKDFEQVLDSLSFN